MGRTARNSEFPQQSNGPGITAGRGRLRPQRAETARTPVVRFVSQQRRWSPSCGPCYETPALSKAEPAAMDPHEPEASLKRLPPTSDPPGWGPRPGLRAGSRRPRHGPMPQSRAAPGPPPGRTDDRPAAADAGTQLPGGSSLGAQINTCARCDGPGEARLMSCLAGSPCCARTSLIASASGRVISWSMSPVNSLLRSRRQPPAAGCRPSPKGGRSGPGTATVLIPKLANGGPPRSCSIGPAANATSPTTTSAGSSSSAAVRSRRWCGTAPPKPVTMSNRILARPRLRARSGSSCPARSGCSRRRSSAGGLPRCR